jgi:Ca2+-binding EF-hand superfamily protein
MTLLSKTLLYFAFGLSVCTSAHADNSIRNKEIADRFVSCDKNRDGKLTKQEAKGCMPRVYDHFSDIDTDNKGYVTVAQIQALASR